jgi:diguanylate cyclase (GGDEF)-like protein
MTDRNLLQQYEFAMNLLENLVTPTFVLDANGKVIIWNLACEQLTGVTADEVIGTKDHWKAFYEEERTCLADLVLSGELEKLDYLYEGYAETSNLSDKGLTAENWCMMPGLGKQLYLAIDVGAIYGQNGEILAVVETLRNMTDYKNTQMTLQELATVDGLTGVANRRCFDERFLLEWTRAQRQFEPLSLILIDVDYFKQYNDNYGHLIGDQCLKRVAEALKLCVKRSTELVARYGGEEFCILLPDTDVQGALTVAERIRAHIENLAMPHEASQCANIVTVSCGVAAMTPTAENESAMLISAADEAVYQAKANGRNQAIKYGEND